MSGRRQLYENDAIAVTFDPGTCIHSAVCLRTLPAVFDVSRRKWIDVDAAGAQEIAAAIRKCPSGALQYTLKGEPPAEPPPAAGADLRLLQDGPVLVAGPVRIVTEDGRVLERDGTVALCRCGATGTKPFCDGSHVRAGFRSVPPLG